MRAANTFLKTDQGLFKAACTQLCNTPGNTLCKINPENLEYSCCLLDKVQKNVYPL